MTSSSGMLLPLLQNAKRGLQDVTACCSVATCNGARCALELLKQKKITELDPSLKRMVYSPSNAEPPLSRYLEMFVEAFSKAEAGLNKLQRVLAQLQNMSEEHLRRHTSLCEDLLGFLETIIPLFEYEFQLRKKLTTLLLTIDVMDPQETKRYTTLWNLSFQCDSCCQIPCLASYSVVRPGWWSFWIGRLEASIQASLHTTLA